MSITIQKALEVAVKQLKESDSARLDTEILLTYILGKPRSYIYTWPEFILDKHTQKRFEQIINKRATGTPVAHLTGQKEFWSQNLNVTEESLIPRPETELLVELALKRIPLDISLDVADFGTGTGAIAITVAKERPKCNLIATDVVADNLLLASNNTSLNHANNIGFVCSNWSAAFNDNVFDMILSNPPYIAEGDPHLTQGDLRFESRTALVSGLDGLDDIRIIIKDASRILKANGWLLLEHGFEQAVQVCSLLMESGFKNIQTYSDLNNNPRVTVAQF